MVVAYDEHLINRIAFMPRLDAAVPSGDHYCVAAIADARSWDAGYHPNLEVLRCRIDYLMGSA
jgi:hypothetical protein